MELVQMICACCDKASFEEEFHPWSEDQESKLAVCPQCDQEMREYDFRYILDLVLKKLS